MSSTTTSPRRRLLLTPINRPAATLSTTYNFTVTYADSIAVNASTLGNGNLAVTAPTGVTLANNGIATLVGTYTSGPSIDATYQITFPSALTTADSGGYQVSVNANSVLDTSNLAVPAGSIGVFTLTVTNPNLIPPDGRCHFVPGGLVQRL